MIRVQAVLCVFVLNVRRLPVPPLSSSCDIRLGRGGVIRAGRGHLRRDGFGNGHHGGNRGGRRG